MTLDLTIVLADREGALERLLGTCRRRGFGLRSLSLDAPEDGELPIDLTLAIGGEDPRRVLATLWRIADIRSIDDRARALETRAA